MKLSRILIVASIIVAWACSRNYVTVQGGKLAGVPSEGGADVTVYKGVPFAAPPVGDLRWKAPQPAPAWKGVFHADEFGKAIPQPVAQEGEFYWHEYYTGGYAELDEDGLTLDIWCPSDARPGDKLPVIVWIHGGGFRSGWSSEVEFDGDGMARRGVILVSVNYRLGVFGFFAHPQVLEENPGSDGNFGLLDQLAALEWVRDNIGAFGGDSDNVTLAGQSAGGISVKLLCASPLSKGLFTRAIIQSGGTNPLEATDIHSAESCTALALKLQELSGGKTLAELRALPWQEIYALADSAAASMPGPFAWWPASGDSFMAFWSSAEAGAIADIPYMVGGTKDDALGLGEGCDDFARFRAAQSANPVYIYEFNRELPGEIAAGAFHAAELWYVFGTLARSSRPFTEGDYALSGRIQDAWCNFARSGIPGGGWKAWTAESPNHAILDVE